MNNIEQQIKHMQQAQIEAKKELIRFIGDEKIVVELKDHIYILNQAVQSLKVLKIMKDYFGS